MMIFSRIKHFFSKYSNLSNLSRREYYSLGLLIFLLKLLMVVLISFLDWKEGVSFYTSLGDDGQYIGYSENLYQTGEYFYDFRNSGNKDYFFRMPGITFLYYPIRFIFNQTITINIVVIIQVLFSTLSIFKFIELINKYFKVNNLLFLFFSVFYAYTAYLDASLMTESLALSSLLLCIYFIDKALCLEEKKLIQKYLLIGGLFLTWLIFLRPYMVPFLLVFSGYVLFKKRIFYMLFFILPFLVVDGAWLIRNFQNHNEFVFLQKSLNWHEKGTKILSSKINFIKSFGFKSVYFEENTHAAWFNNRFEAPSIKIPPNSIFPKRTFVGDLSIDSLIKARSLMHQVVDESLDIKLRINSNIESSRILDKFVNVLKKENPFEYYIFNRFRIFLIFIETNTPKLFLHGPYPFNIILSSLDLLFNILFKYIGLVALVLFLFRSKSISYLILFLSVPIYLFILFPFILRIDESRFFYLSYPFLILSFLLFFNFIFNKIITLVNKK